MTLVAVPHPNDRRRRPRIPIRMPIEVHDGGPPLHALDLGLGGMLVSTARPRWPGQHLLVRFRLPGAAKAIRATCRVLDLVEVPEGIGLSLQFLRLAPKAQLEVVRFVAEALRAGSPPDHETVPV